MPHFCPAYPKPHRNKLSRWLMFFSARRSWLDGLSERSYRMKMGEVHLPGVDLYMVNDPALVKRMLVEQADDFPKSPLLADALRPLLGDSIFTTNGAQWASQRAMMEPAFAQARVSVAFPMMRAAVAAMLARLARLPDGAEHDVEVEMTHVTADIIFRTIFSVPLEGAVAQQLFDAFARFQALAPRLMLPSMYGVRWLVWPWDVRRSRRSARDIRRLLETLIRPRYDAYQASGDHGPEDILASFMRARDGDTQAAFAFSELVDQVAMLFLAGHETSASALTWALYLVAQSPDVQQRLHEESVLQAPGQEPNPSDMKRLSLTRHVFRETLRLFPPVGSMVREAANTCPMRDKTVPKGASVAVSAWLIHRHRDLWREPDAFNPDRFGDGQSTESLQKAYLPFGAGPRICIGAAFALQEAVLILSSLMRSYAFQSVPGHVPQPVARLTIRSANGVRLTVHRRPLAAPSAIDQQPLAGDAR